MLLAWFSHARDRDLNDQRQQPPPPSIQPLPLRSRLREADGIAHESKYLGSHSRPIEEEYLTSVRKICMLPGHIEEQYISRSNHYSRLISPAFCPSVEITHVL